MFYERQCIFASGGAMGAFDEVGQVRREGNRSSGRRCVWNETMSDGRREAEDAFPSEGGDAKCIARRAR